MYQKTVMFMMACCLCATSWAFERPFPETAQRATLSSLSTYPAILLDKKKRILSVGARIWNQHNLIEMPMYIQGTSFTVNYTENIQGEIDRVWILSPEEANKPSPAELAKKRQ